MPYFIVENCFVVRVSPHGLPMERWDHKTQEWVAYRDVNAVVSNGRQVNEATARQFMGRPDKGQEAEENGNSGKDSDGGDARPGRDSVRRQQADEAPAAGKLRR